MRCKLDFPQHDVGGDSPWFMVTRERCQWSGVVGAEGLLRHFPSLPASFPAGAPRPARLYLGILMLRQGTKWYSPGQMGMLSSHSALSPTK
jgi:hypothetical protein